MSADVRAILELHEAWLRAEIEGRTEVLLALCSEDVVIAPPQGQPIVGREAAGAYLRGAAAAIESLSIEDVSIDVMPGMAVKRARYATRLAGSFEDVRGWHLWVLRPSWTLTYLSWSLQPRPSSDDRETG